jgi:hypothetical protein
MKSKMIIGALALSAALTSGGLMMTAEPVSAGEPAATVYKTPQCGCCAEYAKYLDANGYAVTVVEAEDLEPIKRNFAVPEQLEGCHTVVVDGYAVEGHVPVELIDRLLAERPQVNGISLPGMPLGSPGMNGEKQAPFTIYSFGGGAPAVYAVE